MASTSIRFGARRLTWALALLLGCNEHPLQPLDKVVTSGNRQEIGLPAKTKIDFLFMIDNSGSMCEEQENLTRNFSAFSTFLARDLGSAADYRIAVVNSDMRSADARGKFQNKPAPPTPSLNCLDPDTNMPKAPDTADCQDLLVDGALPFDIIKSGNANEGGNIVGDTPADRQADLEKKFRCMATLGTNGDGFEKGLESVRLALSCDGPNGAKFGGCCVGQPKKYDPDCDIDPGAPNAPEFLRPDAVLVVVFVTDEVDCSDPASNPAAASKAICKYGPGGGTGPADPPNGFADAALCNGESAGACYTRECGQLNAEDCYKQRCVVDRSQNSNCEWFRDRLTPVQEYFEFLIKLKLKPNESIVVAAIAGPRAFTESGAEITYNLPERHPDATCDIKSDMYDPDKPLDQCCPQGECKGEIQPSCTTANGVAFSGRRYLEFVEKFEGNGIGCPVNFEDTPGAVCVNICTDDFATPLQEIQQKVAAIIGTYCLDKRPACAVRTGTDARACATEAERADVGNYFLELSRGCRADEIGAECLNALAAECGGGNDRCEQGASGSDLRIRFGADEYTLNPNEPACPSGFELQLRNPPPAGSEIFLEFQVDLDDAPSSPAAGGGASGGGAGGAAAPDAGP